MLLPRLHHLRRAPLEPGVYAPQKPILLLALIDYVEQTGLKQNRFIIDERPARLRRCAHGRGSPHISFFQHWQQRRHQRIGALP